MVRSNCGGIPTSDGAPLPHVGGMAASFPPAHVLHGAHPVDVVFQPEARLRNRLTSAFRAVLAIPHLLLVGGPAAVAISWLGESRGEHAAWAATGGVLGGVAVMAAVVTWVAILVGARFPEGSWKLGASYMRWRVRAVAYLTLLSDEYPPFGEGDHPVSLKLDRPAEPRDRLAILFRIVLALPHIAILWVLGVAWAMVTIVAWFAILFTGTYPQTLQEFSVDVFRWSTRVEVYLLLLRDEYPPFSFDRH